MSGGGWHVTMIRNRRDRPPGDAADELVGQGEALLERAMASSRLDASISAIVTWSTLAYGGSLHAASAGTARGERGACACGWFLSELESGGFSGVGR